MIAEMLLRPLKKLARRSLSLAGFAVIRKRDLPYGFDVWHDIRRLSLARGGEPVTFFDVGANIGQTSLRIAGEFPAAKIFAFEPTPSVFSELQENIASSSAISAHNIALGSAAGVADLFVYSD